MEMEKKSVIRNFNRRYAYEYTIFRTIFYMLFLNIVVRGIVSLCYNYKITGRENLSKRNRRADKFLYTANHVSNLDPPFVSLAINRPIAYMAKKELFENNDKRNWLVKRLGAFAVDRSKPEIATFKTVKDILSTTWSIGVFPQGGIKPYGELTEIKKGFIVIAKHAKADIVPVAVSDFSGYPQWRPFKKQTVNLHIGEPISYELSEEEITYQWCKQISEMSDYVNKIPAPKDAQELAVSS